MNSFETFRDAVEKAQLKVINAHGDAFQAQCPVHEDKAPSMSVNYRNGKVLVRCHGCEADVRDIVAALGLTMEDLFDEEPDRDNNKLPIAEYRYVDPQTSEIVFVKRRYYPKTFLIFHPDITGEMKPGLPKDVRPWLYHSPELKQALDRGEPIWVVEGEADVHAIEHLGGAATTQPHGAGRDKWKPLHTWQLGRAKEVRIVVDLDQDQADGRNIGRDYALAVRDSLMGAGIKVTLWKSPAGKDASDALKAGKTLADFTRYDLGQLRVKGITGLDLEEKEFPPLIFAVKKILPQGLAILAGPPKSAKSFVALDMAVGVSVGGLCMSALQCTQGDVLYIGLEDSERRLKSRIDLLCEGHWPDLSHIEFQTIDSGWEGADTGLAWMEEWALEKENPRLIVIDTMGKAEPTLDEALNRYLAEQAMMLKYKRFADRHDLTVLFIHHDRKANDDSDWMNKLSGSKGITGGADTLLYIDFKRGERDGVLRVDGRDVEADDVSITKPRGRPFWKAISAPESLEDEVWVPGASQSPSGREDAVLSLMKGHGKPISYSQIIAAFPGEQIGDTVGYLLRHNQVTKLPGGDLRLA